MAALVRLHKLGRVVTDQEYDFDGNAHGPDVSFFSPQKEKLVEGELRVERFVPDLALRFASKRDRFDTLFEKAPPYRRCGTAEVYVFSIKTKQIFRYSAEHTVVLNETDEFCPAQIPGFNIGICDLFWMI